jgi:hypothetical protein
LNHSEQDFVAAGLLFPCCSLAGFRSVAAMKQQQTSNETALKQLSDSKDAIYPFWEFLNEVVVDEVQKN